MMEILSLDLSLTSTGFAASSGEGVLPPPKGKESRGVPRLLYYRERILQLAEDADLSVLEGYSFGARRQSHTRAIAELGGVVRVALWEAQTPFVEVPPASLKKYATGKGNAGKELVLVEAVKRLGYEGADHNEADALWLRQMALAHYGQEEAVEVPKTHRVALEKIEWPEVGEKSRKGPAQLSLVG